MRRRRNPKPRTKGPSISATVPAPMCIRIQPFFATYGPRASGVRRKYGVTKPMTNPSPTNSAMPSRVLLAVRETVFGLTAAAFDTASMTYFDVSPARVLLGDDLSNAVRHGLLVRQ